MRVSNLSLVNFRNFSRNHVEFASGFNLIIAPNARGKTNLLESLYLLSTGLSLRSSSLKELVKFGEEVLRVEAITFQKQRESKIELGIEHGRVRFFKVNGLPFNRKKEKTPLPVSLFTPDHLRLIKGSPEERRELLDGILSQIKPSYAYHRTHYSKVMRERNAALQNVAAGKMGQEVIALFDDQLISSGIVLVQERAWLVDTLSALSAAIHKDLAVPGLSLTYVSQIDPEEAEASFRRKLQERKVAELSRGVTLVGPHRDDVSIDLNGLAMKSFGSQGEQRTACLAIKFAEMAVLKESFHVKPIFLLDDVMSELDEARRRALMERVLFHGQALLTSTNVDYFSKEELAAAKVIDLA